MEERPTCLFVPLGANICFGAFPMPPISTVLVHSSLFLLACAITLMEKSLTRVHTLDKREISKARREEKEKRA
jgi:hypothetical protein